MLEEQFEQLHVVVLVFCVHRREIGSSLAPKQLRYCHHVFLGVPLDCLHILGSLLHEADHFAEQMVTVNRAMSLPHFFGELRAIENQVYKLVALNPLFHEQLVREY